MTANQINYRDVMRKVQADKETARYNKAQEELTERGQNMNFVSNIIGAAIKGPGNAVVSNALNPVSKSMSSGLSSNMNFKIPKVTNKFKKRR